MLRVEGVTCVGALGSRGAPGGSTAAGPPAPAPPPMCPTMESAEPNEQPLKMEGVH